MFWLPVSWWSSTAWLILNPPIRIRCTCSQSISFRSWQNYCLYLELINPKRPWTHYLKFWRARAAYVRRSLSTQIHEISTIKLYGLTSSLSVSFTEYGLWKLHGSISWDMLLARHCTLPLSFEFKKDSCIIAALEEEDEGDDDKGESLVTGGSTSSLQ